MGTVVTIGLDLAKYVFQVHGVDDSGEVAARRGEVLKFFASLPPCLVGMEACASSHFWAREIAVLGHQALLMPPAYVKRGKTDAADAEAICEAVTRPTMRFVAIKSAGQQAVRAHLAEYGMIAAQGPGGVSVLRTVFVDKRDSLPAYAREAIDALLAQIAGAVAALKDSETVLDGEAICLGPNGENRFEALRSGEGAVSACLVAFDIIELDGEDLRRVPLQERKSRLGPFLNRAPDGLAVSATFLGCQRRRQNVPDGGVKVYQSG